MLMAQLVTGPEDSGQFFMITVTITVKCEQEVELSLRTARQRHITLEMNSLQLNKCTF